MERRNLLVVGSPRSGTTLLAAMLGAHPDIGIINEDFTQAHIRIISKRISGVKLTVPNQLELKRRATSWSTKLDKVPGLRRVIGKRIPKSRWSLTDYLGLPNLDIVAIVRDPASTISSIQERGRQSRGEAEYRWSRAIEVMGYVARMHPRVHIVRFDRLVAEPKRTITEALEFVGCTFDQRVMEGFAHTPQYPGRKAVDSTKEVPLEASYDHELFARRPDLANTYKQLIALGPR